MEDIWDIFKSPTVANPYFWILLQINANHIVDLDVNFWYLESDVELIPLEANQSQEKFFIYRYNYDILTV